MLADLSLIIQRMLLELGEASIPGLGTLKLIRVGARYEKSEPKIYPPHYDLTFSDEITNPDLFGTYFARHYGLSKEDSALRIARSVNELMNKITDDKENAILEDIGLFKLEDDNVVFEQLSNLKNWYTTGLLPVVPVLVEIKQMLFQL